MRVNTESLPLPEDRWSESKAWDELATWYQGEFGSAQSK
jgi:hypothetical protein